MFGIKIPQKVVGERYWNSQFNMILSQFSIELSQTKNPISFHKFTRNLECDEIWKMGEILFVFELKENDVSDISFNPPQDFMCQGVTYASRFMEEKSLKISFKDAIKFIFVVGVNFDTTMVDGMVNPKFLWSEIKLLDNLKGIEILTENKYTIGMGEFFNRVMALWNDLLPNSE